MATGLATPPLLWEQTAALTSSLGSRLSSSLNAVPTRLLTWGGSSPALRGYSLGILPVSSWGTERAPREGPEGEKGSHPPRPQRKVQVLTASRRQIFFSSSTFWSSFSWRSFSFLFSSIIFSFFCSSLTSESWEPEKYTLYIRGFADKSLFFFWSSNSRSPKAVQASKTTQYSKYNIQQAGFYEIRAFSNLQSISLHDKSHVHIPKNTLPKPQIIALVLSTIHLIFWLWLCFWDRHRGSSLGLHTSRHPHAAVRLFPSRFSLPPQSREISKVRSRAEHYLEAFIFSAHFWRSSEQFNSWNRCLKSAWIIFPLEFDKTYSTFKDWLTGKHTNLLTDQGYTGVYPFLSPYLVTGGRETADYTIDVTVSDT